MWLTVISGRDAGKTVEITGERFRIGRSRDCDLVLRDPAVEPVHAELRREPHGWLLDNLAAGGTYVATKRILRPVTLRGDEELCFGETFARLSPTGPKARRSKRPAPAVAAAIAVAVAAAGVTAAILAPRVGNDGDGSRTLALSAPADEPDGQTAAGERPSTEPGTAGAEGEEGPVATAPAETDEAPARPQVVFRDDFSDPGSGWEVFEGSGASGGYEDGAYVLAITDSSYLATADSGRSFEGPLVSVTVENPSLAPKAGFGIVCGYRDQQNFYLLGVGTDGTAAIVRFRDGKTTLLTGDGGWIRVPGIPVAAPSYRIRARCDDGGLALSVNGRRVLTAARPEPEGTVGLFAAGAAELRFDDFVVRAQV